MRYKLGKKKARLSIFPAFGSHIDLRKLPPVPATFGHIRNSMYFPMYANDKYGCCVFAGAHHETRVWNNAAGRQFSSTEKNCLSDYAAVTGFDPNNPDTDQGTDMQDAAVYRQKTGIIDSFGIRHKIIGSVALQPGNWAQLCAGMYFFGAVGIGWRLPETADDLFDEHRPWDFNSRLQIDGGHYTAGLSINSAGNLVVVTWGGLQAATRRAYEDYCDEALVYFTEENLQSGVSPDGFDVVGLRKYWSALGGR